MDFRWLQDFLALAETGHFTAAAESRHSSQPAFSRRIQSLENWLGVELFDRARYPTTLTPAGESFRQQAADMVKRAIESRAQLRGEPLDGISHLTFALPHTLAISCFPKWWNEWRKGLPATSCKIVASNVHDAVTALVSGMADVLICYHHAQQPVFLDPHLYEKIDLGTEWLRPYAAVRRDAVAFELPGKQGSAVPLLSYSPGTFLGRMVDIILSAVPGPLYAETECVSDMANVLLEMAVEGHGVAWLPEHTAKAETQAGRLKSLAGDRLAIPLTIVAYADRNNTNSITRKFTRSLLSADAIASK